MNFVTLRERITAHTGLLLTLWWIACFAATHLPAPEAAAGIPYADKVAHFIIYFGLSFLLAAWWSKRRHIGSQQLVVFFVILLTYAFFDEALQTFVARTPDVQDVIADVVGITSGLSIFLVNKEKLVTKEWRVESHKGKIE